jgi:hypothetical protein
VDGPKAKAAKPRRLAKSRAKNPAAQVLQPLFAERVEVGWCEWIHIDAPHEPSLDLPPLRVKVDTGARTSSVHAEDAEVVERGGKRFVRFALPLPHRPPEGSEAERYVVEAPLVGERHVRSSNGQQQSRLTVRMTLRLGGRAWEADVTLARRAPLRFPMLLGRSAMQSGNLVVVPSARYLLGRLG